MARVTKAMKNRLRKIDPSSLVNCIIDNCDYSSTLDAKTKSDETLRVSIPFQSLSEHSQKTKARSQFKNRH